MVTETSSDATLVVTTSSAFEAECKLGEAALIAKYGNKSNAIRALYAMDNKCGPISRALNISFQHARNVSAKPLKRVIKAERDAATAAATATKTE
jgi:hypothetical protein